MSKHGGAAMEYMTCKNKKVNGKTLSKKHMALMMITLIASVIFIAMPVYAANTSAVTAKFDTLQDIVSSIISSIGTIVVLWGIFEFGNSMQTQEGGAQSQAMKRIGGGLVMVIAPQLLALLA